MGRKQKYEEVRKYWVYSIQIPSVNKYYIGVSKRKKCSQRWQKSKYKDMTLNQYLDEWDSMVKTVLVDNLSKEEALKYEDNIIQALKMNDLCINERRSGLIKTNDKTAYYKELRKNNPKYHEQYNEYHKQYYENNKEKLRQRQRQYRLNNKEKIQEYNKQRYENDVEYREQQKQRIKQWRLKKRLEKQQNQTVVD